MARLAVLWLVGAGLAACQGAPDSLQAPPRPEIGAYEESVRRQFLERYEVLERLLALEPRNAEALAQAFGALGMIFDAYQDQEPASVCYRHAHELDGREYRWAYLLGLSERSLGRFADSDKALQAVLTLRPGDVPTLVWLGENAFAQNHLDLAAERFQEALAVAPRCAKARLGLGRVALEHGDGRQAVAHLEMAHAVQPQATPVLYTLGLAYRAVGDLERAQTMFDQVQRSHLHRREVALDDPLAREVQSLQRGAMAHEHRGLKAAAQKHYSVAAAELGEAVAIDGDRLEARHNLALAYLHLGRRQEARSELEEVLLRNPDFAPSHLVIALLLREDGRLDEAERHLRQAIELDPSLAKAHLVLGERVESEP